MLTRFAPVVAVIVAVGCAAHPRVFTPTSAPTPAPACVAKTDSLQTDLTDPGDSSLVVSIADTTARPCGPDRLTFVIHAIDPRTARDALDAGVDLLITDDPAAIAYAATRPDYVSLPLPWRRRYVLALAAETDTTRLPQLRRALTDAVRVTARPAEGDVCTDRAPAERAERRPRVVYAEDDSAGRALAERLVALADRPDAPVPTVLAQQGARLRAVGLPSTALADALATGEDVAYVVGVPLSACTDGIPLIETRPHAIIRRDLHLVVSR